MKSIKRLSLRTRAFQESIIREMTRIGAETGGIDLAQGLPDFEPPGEILIALHSIIDQGHSHQYAFTWGSWELRSAVSEKYARFNHLSVDPETEITITCGVSEALASTIFALTEPGDEIIIFEPFYENYLPVCLMAGCRPRFVPLQEPGYRLDLYSLKKAVTSKTRLIILNTPGNPSGRVLDRRELSEIAAICQKSGIIAVVDEIYEHIWYENNRHISLASLPGMKGLTVTLSGLGKSYVVTGWRVGWAIADPRLTGLIRKVHDYLTVCAPAPFQTAGCVALGLPGSYYLKMRQEYSRRRDLLLGILAQAGFNFTPPQGSYYVMADFSPLGWDDDRAFAGYLARKIGIITVPGSSFYAGKTKKTCVRINFAKKEETLLSAAERLFKRDLHRASPC